MVVQGPLGAPAESPVIEAPDAGVIADARARQRRHRVGAALVALAAAALGGWLALGGAGGDRGAGAARAGHSSTPAGAHSTRNAPTVATRALGSSVDYFMVEPYRSAMLLLSGVENTGERCVWTLVSARTLRVTASLRRSCAAPALATEPFVPVNVERPNMTFSVRVARPNRNPRRVVLGPVVMVHNEVSDTHLEWAYGAGLLWIYDVAAIDPKAAARPQGRRNPHAEVVEVSLATGRLVRVVRTPTLDRPFVVADDDGLWLVPSTETGVSPGAGGGRAYMLAPGARSFRVEHRAGYAAAWALATNHTLWQDVLSLHGAGAPHQELWRFDGASGVVHAVGRLQAAAREYVPTLGSGGTLWMLRSILDPGTTNSCSRQQVIAIGGTNAASHVIATLQRPLDDCFPVPWNQPFGGTGSGQLYAAGAYYFLDAEQSTTTLDRIHP
jgi:hypothetical protein